MSDENIHNNNNKMKEICVDDNDILQHQSNENDNFVIECSDEEKYEITPDDMISVYKRIAIGDLELCQKLVRIRSPSPEQLEETTEDVNKKMSLEKERMEEISEEKSVVEEFDFDFVETSRLLTPRRTIGSIKTPRNTQKRVAQWDKIMNDYMKYQKLEEKYEVPKDSIHISVSNISSSVETIVSPVKNIPINVASDLESVTFGNVVKTSDSPDGGVSSLGGNNKVVDDLKTGDEDVLKTDDDKG